MGTERAKNGLEKGQEQVLNGIKKGIARFEDLERARMALQPLSRSFLPFFHRSSPFFTRFSRFWLKREKRVSEFRETGKERKEFFPVSFPFPFFHLSFPGTSVVRTHARCCG